jgi:hypothetical protein
MGRVKTKTEILNLKSENQELRNENEKLELKGYRANKKVAILENALTEIRKTLSQNQLGSATNYQNQIRKVLADCDGRLELNKCK